MAINPKCFVIAVVGGKGGVGKSVFSVNLAVALMRELKAKTLLVDLDQRSCGDQNILTGLRPKKTVNDVTSFTGVISPQTLDTLVATHPSGLAYLGAVHSADQSLSAPGDLFAKQLSSLSQFYNFIVVDLGNDFTDLQTAVLEEASVVLSLTTPEVLAVNQTKRVTQELIAQFLPAEYLYVVINNAGRNSLDPKLIQQTIGRPIIGSIPQDDMTVYSSIQRSMPFMLTQAQGPLAAAYSDIVRKLSGGLLQKLKGLSKPKKAVAQISETTAPVKSGNKSQSPEILLKLQIHSALIKEMDLKKDLTKSKGDPVREQELRQKTQKAISLIADRLIPSLSRDERSRIIKQVLDESLGLGPLEELLDDPSITEIMVNGSDTIFIE
jgi:septum site-determining protein MinD